MYDIHCYTMLYNGLLVYVGVHILLYNIMQMWLHKIITCFSLKLLLRSQTKSSTIHDTIQDVSRSIIKDLRQRQLMAKVSKC